MAKRQRGDHLEGLWEFPGGKIEAGETPQECLARELEEEFHVRAEVGDFIGSNRHDYDGRQIELLAYEVHVPTGEFRLNEHEEIHWVPIERLLTYDLAPADVPIAIHMLEKT